MTPDWSPDDLDRIDRLLAGEASAEERAQAEALLAEDPASAARYQAAVAAIRDEGGIAPEPDILWARFGARNQVDRMPSMRNRMSGERVPASGLPKVWSRRHGVENIGWFRTWSLGKRTLRNWLSLALLCVGICGGWFVWSGHHLSSHADAVVYRTAPGQQSTVRLADGSTIQLAPATSVVSTTRGFEVVGEAYFTIAPHADRPFLVRTSNASMQVLGTRFTVRQYPGEAQSRVVVEDGRLSLHALRNHRESTPTVVSDLMMAFVTDSGITVTAGIVVKEYTSWTRGVLTFEHVPLANVVTEISRAYGADIRIADTTLAKAPVMMMEVSVTEDLLWQTLARICLVSDAHVVRDGHAYVLTPGRSSHGTNIPPALDVPRRNTFPQPEKLYGR